MNESKRWGSLQYLTLLLVIMAHMALVACLMMALRARQDADVTAESVQLVLLPPQSLPKIPLDRLRPRYVESRLLVADPPPLIEATSSSTWAPPYGSGLRDGGSGVDWAAEARRALQAFEIRSRQPAANSSVSRSSPAEQLWWPAHRPRERVKTADGNWIVWINSSCYEVAASWPSAGAASGSAAQPLTICPKRTDAPDEGASPPAR